MNVPIEYYNSIGNYYQWGIDPATMFENLKNELEWEKRDAPRKECFLSTRPDEYTYGKGAGIRTYYPKLFTIDAFPNAYNWKIVAETFAECELEACFLNYYEGPRDHLGWHADDSDVIDDSRPIIVISLGAEREIYFRENGKADYDKLLLQNGSVLIMKAGMQDTHQHRIPKHGANCGERISLTFRGLI